MDYNLHKAKGSEDVCSNVLEIKLAELSKTKEELKKAKDDATQSWLDSRPHIDELEKLQTELADEKERATKSSTVISELESQLEDTRLGIRSRKEDEVKVRGTIDQINLSLDKLREEMEQLKMETDEERRARSKMKQVLRSRKQTFQTLQLTLRAARIESEALGASSAKSFHYISCAEKYNDTIQLTMDEYNALKTKAKEETSLADWRVSLAVEQRLLAEKNRELARTRLQAQHMDSRSRNNKIENGIYKNKNVVREEHDATIDVGDQVVSRQNTFPRARAKLMAKSKPHPQQIKRSKSNNERTKTMKERKPSIFVQIRTFLARKIASWFG